MGIWSKLRYRFMKYDVFRLPLPLFLCFLIHCVTAHISNFMKTTKECRCEFWPFFLTSLLYKCYYKLWHRSCYRKPELKCHSPPSCIMSDVSETRPTCTDWWSLQPIYCRYLTVCTFVLAVTCMVFFFFLQASRALWGRCWHNSGSPEKCEGLREISTQFVAADLPVWILCVLGERHHL